MTNFEYGVREFCKDAGYSEASANLFVEKANLMMKNAMADGLTGKEKKKKEMISEEDKPADEEGDSTAAPDSMEIEDNASAMWKATESGKK